MNAVRPLSHSAFIAVLALMVLIPSHTGAQTTEDYFASVDTDGDRRISLAEYRARMSYAFRQMDRNHNDVLELDEQLVPSAGPLTLVEHHSRLDAQFRRQDKDRSGWLSLAELLAPPG